MLNIKTKAHIKVKGKNESNRVGVQSSSLFLLSFVFLFSGAFSIDSRLHAANYNYSISPAVEDTSNIGGINGGPGGTVKSIGLGFSLNSEDTREWRFLIDSDFESNFYPEDTFDDEEIYSLQAQAVYTPTNLNLVVTTLATAGQTAINRFRVETVNNLRDERVFLFQPRYFVSLTRSDRFNFEYGYFDYYLEESEELQSFQDSSNVTQSFLINYEKDINQTNTLSLNLRTAKTKFEDPLDLNAIDYERDDLFLRWVVSGRTNQIQIDLGESKITDDFGFDLKQDLKIISVTRQINQNSQIEFSYSDSFNNQVLGNQATGTINVDQQNSLTGFQKVEQHSLTYVYNNGYFNGNLGISKSRIDQIQQGNDEDRESSNVGIGYQLTRFFNGAERVQIALNYSKTQGEFDSELTNIVANEIENKRLSFTYTLNSKMEITLSREERVTLQTSLLEPTVPVEIDTTRLTFTYQDNGRF